MPADGSALPRRAVRFYRHRLTAPILLGLICFVVYNANLRQIGSGDTLPARYLPLILWHDHTLDLDANAQLVAHGHSMIADRYKNGSNDSKINYFEPSAYWMAETRRHQLASLYPVVTPLLVAPLYLPAVVWLDHRGWEQPRIDRVAELMEKISASFLASLASVLMFLVLRREKVRWPMPLACVFAFGTNTWMISSQALWQHSGGEFLIALALLLVVANASPLRIALLGAVCVLMAANRPPDALIAGALVLFIVWSRRRTSLWLLAGGAVPLAALLYYNLHFIGDIAGGYALAKVPPNQFFHFSLSGLAGLLISPARGLLVFTPFLVFVPVGLMQRLRTTGSKGLAVALSFAVVAQFLLYSQADWRAGVSWGPRWLTDLLPILMWLLAPTLLVLRSRVRWLIILAMAASVVVQTIGAFWYTKASDERIFAGAPGSMRGAWNPRSLPFLLELRHARPHGVLQCDASASIDRVGTRQLAVGRDVPELRLGAVVEGEALACGRPPALLMVLIDGIVIGSTRSLGPNAGEREALSTISRWRVFADTRGVDPGERVLQIAVLVEPGSDVRIVHEQRVSVIARDSENQSADISQQRKLDAMADYAALLLRERQRQGFWLTSYTQGLGYEAPQQEMNTYLTAMLVDLLAPIAPQRNLDDVVDHARKHLAAQIESDGLVRYHGLPNASTIGRLGCVITPDADDTALAWRIAGPGAGDPRAQLMLQSLNRYRDARGLFRTWLAPRNEYQCLDPGTDPNPADVVIQMHIYLMLREFDKPAAEDLCTALQRSYEDEGIWTYYAKAPLVPYLRSAELQQLGCVMPLPAERLAAPAPGQELWSEAVRLFVQAKTSPQDEKVRLAIRNLLMRLGRDDFALLRSPPPMLYHNDLSATVKRYYWSEDFGYALWLRLYEAAGVETRNRN